MSLSARRERKGYSLTQAAWEKYSGSGFLFTGAPPMRDYVHLGKIRLLAQLLGRALEVTDLKALFRLHGRVNALGGDVYVVNFFWFKAGCEDDLQSRGITVVVRSEAVTVETVQIRANRHHRSRDTREHGRNGVRGKHKARRELLS